MRCQIIAELASNHGGNIELALDLIRAAADAGADWVKTQGYQVIHLSPQDPQYTWLQQAELSPRDHERLAREAERRGVNYLTTVFHPDDYRQLSSLVQHFKIGHGEAAATWWHQLTKVMFVSYAWRARSPPFGGIQPLVTVPLYPMPVVCWPAVCKEVSPVTGWSDHAQGLDLAKLAIARQCPVVEKHFSLPGRGRNQAWDVTPPLLEELRQWAEQAHLAHEGNPAENRWTFKG